MSGLDKMLQQLAQSEADAYLLSSEASRQYAAGAAIAEGVALVSEKGSVYLTDSRYIEAAQNRIHGLSVQMVDRENPYRMLLNAVIREWEIATVGYEENVLTAGELSRYTASLEAKLIPTQREISSVREVKSEEEIAALRAAQAISDTSFTQLLPCICAGMTEKELQAELIYLLYKNGAEGLSFDPIVVSGENTSMPHGVAGDRQLAYGDFITMDFGCRLGGYCSDTTRTVALGFVSSEMHAVYDTVLTAQAVGMAATRAGVLCKDVDRAARDVIEKVGYGAYFGHSYGHSVGLEIHESPNCSPSDGSVLRSGVVCSAEPGIYLPGKFGVRIEDVVVVRDDGCESLTALPKKLLIL